MDNKIISFINDKKTIDLYIGNLPDKVFPVIYL